MVISERSPADPSPALSVLTASPLFHNLESAAQVEIAGDLTFVALAAGEALFRQDDPGDSMYIVESGLLEVRVREADGAELVLDRLDAGEGVGEMALLTGRPRTADVVAMVDSRLLCIPKGAFDRLVERRSTIAADFALAIAPRIQRLQLAGILTRLFGPLDPATLHTIQEQVTWRRLADGERLFHQGELGTSMFIVVNGRLQVVLERDESGGLERDLGEIGPGETTGEYALLTDEIRSASVYAIRDTDVVELTRPIFERLIEAHPQAMVEIARIIITRQKRALRPLSTRAASHRLTALSIAIFPAGRDGAPLADFAASLAESLSVFGPTALFTGERFDDAFGKPGAALTEPDDALSLVLNHWLQQQESDFRHILYVADAEWTAWGRRCLAQADRVLLVGMAGGNPGPGPLESYCAPRLRKELVLLYAPDAAEPSGTRAWLEPREEAAGVDAAGVGAASLVHHHVRQGDRAHWERLARRLTGRAVGMAFSGGAARGFAHVGVIRALEEAGQPVDYIGGSSMGALVGGGWAMGLTPAQGMERAARIANPGYLLDRTFPYTAVMASRKITLALREMFGERQIEDLWRPFFCVSTNLSAAAPVIHDRGPLWRAVRASISLPGIFSPILNEKNELLVDGGVMNNFPVDILAARAEFGLIIGSNVSPHREQPYPYPLGESVSGWRVLWSYANLFGQPLPAPRLGSIILRTVEVNSLYHRKSVEQLADILIEPDVRDFNFLDFEAYETMERRGYEAARQALEDRG